MTNEIKTFIYVKWNVLLLIFEFFLPFRFKFALIQLVAHRLFSELNKYQIKFLPNFWNIQYKRIYNVIFIITPCLELPLNLKFYFLANKKCIWNKLGYEFIYFSIKLKHQLCTFKFLFEFRFYCAWKKCFYYLLISAICI